MLLKYLRVTAALLFCAALSVFFIDYLGRLPLEMHRLAHIQIVPALLGGFASILVVWIAITLLFGRIYCSVVCPLGIMQDAIARCSRLLQRKHRYTFRQPEQYLQYGILTVCCASFLLNIHLILSLFDPYGIYGRMMTHLLRPMVIFGHNQVASIANSQNYHGIWFIQNILCWQSIAVSLVMLLLIAHLAWHYGRLYCNTICPVGTIFGCLSRYSLFRVRLREDCISCGLCEQRCKAECIDSKEKTVDSSRCVACFNCLNVCKKGALLYGINAASPVPVKDKDSTGVPAKSRRTFLGTLYAIIGASLGAGASLPTGVSKLPYKKTHPIMPPGAGNIKRFQKRCTACHLCVTKCPDHVIRPAIGDYGVSGFLQPVMSFEHGYCIFDCVICSQVCPNRALLPLDMKEKHHSQIGKVIFIQDNCVVDAQRTHCGACAEHCPTGAVMMIPFGKPEEALTLPKIDADLCIGCGACEYICPVRPYRAIYVDGQPMHLEAKPAFDPTEKQQEVILDDFGF